MITTSIIIQFFRLLATIFMAESGQKKKTIKERWIELTIMLKAWWKTPGLIIESLASYKQKPEEEIPMDYPSTEMSDEAQFGYDVYRLITVEINQYRRSLSKYIFDSAHADMLWEEEDYKRQFAEFAFHYYKPSNAISLVFLRVYRKALWNRYKKMLAKTNDKNAAFVEFYSKYHMMIKPIREITRYKLKKENPLLDKVRECDEVKGFFCEAARRDIYEQMEDYDRMGYLAVFTKSSELGGSDWALINNLYCRGEILFDFWDFISCSQISTFTRKKVSDLFEKYWETKSDSSKKMYKECLEQYIAVNQMGSTRIEKLSIRQKLLKGLNALKRIR